MITLHNQILSYHVRQEISSSNKHLFRYICILYTLAYVNAKRTKLKLFFQ